ncbi:MAG TPA: GNAT family N-acetyltransferase [Bacillota bacterium]|nr:GNAT family N-acetyltransferase [Bacillota bacterium]
MIIRQAKWDDEEQMATLICGFRAELRSLRGGDASADLDEGRREFQGYMRQGWPIFVAEDEGGTLVGYLVCRIDDGVVWAESLYVLPAQRRKGIASQLYDCAEELARELGEDQVYNWVHPDNHRIIAFLAKRGYDVLNLIELRKPLPGEKFTQRLKVGEHEYQYLKKEEVDRQAGFDLNNVESVVKFYVNPFCQVSGHVPSSIGRVRQIRSFAKSDTSWGRCCLWYVGSLTE